MSTYVYNLIQISQLYNRWDNNHGATVVCKALGFSFGLHYLASGGTGPMIGHQKNIQCEGGEADVWECPTPGILDCNHAEHDAGAHCFGTILDDQENNPDTLQIHGIWGSVPGEERLECQSGSFCDRENKKCVSLPSECPAMPSAASESCLCPTAMERCQQDCRTERAPKPDSVRLSSEEEKADNCIDIDLTTNCNSKDSKEFPFLVLKYAEPITVKQVFVWYNGEKSHRAQNLKVFVLSDENSLQDDTLIEVDEEFLLGSFNGPPEDSQDYISFGDQCSPGIEGSVVVIQRDTLGWGDACPECLALDLAEVAVMTKVADNGDTSCSSVSTIPPKEITMSGRLPGDPDVGGFGKNPWVLFEFEHVIRVKEVVILPMLKDHVKDVKVFVGMQRPTVEEDSKEDKLFMNEPVCGEYIPPKKKEYRDFFEIEDSFTVKGKIQIIF